MVVGYFTYLFCMSVLLGYSSTISINKVTRTNDFIHLSTKESTESSVLENTRRNRRKLPTDTSNQQDNFDNSLQYQEYQGVFGRPGIDFPVYSSIPLTKFNCRQVKKSNIGYYADIDTQCQVFHVCDGGRKISFLCPNGTIFRQSHLICDWWFRVDCERSPELYDDSVQQLEADQNVYKQRAEAIANAMHDAFSTVKKKDKSMLLESPVSVTNNARPFNSETGVAMLKTDINNFDHKTQNQKSTLSTISSTLNPVSFKPSPLSHSGQSKINETVTVENLFIENDIREQQILAETASFAGSKYPSFGNYYAYNNFVQHPSKQTEKESTTAQQTTYSTEGFTGSEDLFRTPKNNTNDLYSLYYATDEQSNNQDISTGSYDVQTVTDGFSRPDVSEMLITQTAITDEMTETPISQTIPVLLTNMTKESYTQLFANERINLSSTTGRDNFIINVTPVGDLEGDNSYGLVQSSSSKPKADIKSKLKFKSSPDLRELAQVFSRALSAYLEDPEQFRKVLSEVRPTEPPISNENNLVNEASLNDEVLAFSEDFKTYPASHLSRTTTVEPFTTLIPTTIRDPETFAEEVNNFMFTNSNFQGADSGEFNVNETYYPSSVGYTHSLNNSRTTSPLFTSVSFAQYTVSPILDFTNNYTQPTTSLPTSNSIANNNNYYTDIDHNYSQDQEQLLQTADTQSFVSRDNLLRYQYSNNNIQPVKLMTNVEMDSKRNQFGMRTISTTTVSSGNTLNQNYKSSSAATTYHPDISTVYQEQMTTQIQEQSDNMKPSAKMLMNIMDEAKTNNALRHQLVLLLVNDKNSASNNKNVKEMKSKLLKALLKQPPNEVGNEKRDVTKPKKGGRVRVYKHKISEDTHRQVPVVPETTLRFSEYAVTTTTTTSSPITEPSGLEELSESDSRAVDLLKTLYMLASNNLN